MELSVQEFDKTDIFYLKINPKSSAMSSLSLVLLACVYFPACVGDLFFILCFRPTREMTAKREGT